ncbi:hypothetical protein CLV46_1916 [Diaminobutyricimonas aerilata]|uniref:Peptidase S9 prolyl oligopeptidase catalytic domain-containing protein n=1 Tax=Diaminobutyricimonas aerilata TaxID=1162967 RepID=A0A2M9CKC3_9MICO|nr:prolyl oligopeptidase family serine peptidase [Diaminobutyricimonas aerilata]PJJ72345.1 hypothetical protein CLV46_1916 [Diaminobutyricimonas aerilata]
MPASRRWRPRRVAGLAALGAVAASALVGATAAVTTVLVARTVITPPRRRIEDTRVLAVEGDRVVLSRSADATVPGRYSFWFDHGRGHAKLGDIVAHDDRSVTRELLGVDFGDIARARRGRFAGWFWLSPRDLPYEHRQVEIATEVGPAPAWLVPGGDGSDWVIQVHGRAVRRSEALRAIPVFHDAGYTSLLISYRNDGDAPESGDGRYALGDREWRDVEAAMRFALEHGATRIVLMGWSMGGATVLQAVTRSTVADAVVGVILESPVVDWVTTLTYQSEELGLPPAIRRGVIALLGGRRGHRLAGLAEPIDFARLDLVANADELHVPTLILHSDDDGFVPVTASRALALARPDTVTFEAFTVARHTKLWNYDADRWNAAIGSWLTRLRESSGRTTSPRRR